MICAQTGQGIVEITCDIERGNPFSVAVVMSAFAQDHDVIADAAVLEGSKHSEELAGKIVLIPQADPGYDWLFGHGIAGLVTMYGGANSHMAIRAAELNLAAAIGVGEQSYSALARARIIDLDCMSKKVRVVR